MGKIQILTREQTLILDEIKQNQLLCSSFYFTGETALSACYLQHRESVDLDFFSEKKFDNRAILEIIERLSKKYNFTIQSRLSEVVYVFNLIFPNKINLKVDFGYYPYRRIEKGTMLNNFQVDSLMDIAINKLLTISQRTEVKDFVDLYFLLKKFSLWDLREGVRVKFRMDNDPELISADFLKVEDFDLLPKMIKPLTLDQLKLFYRNKAKELAKKSTI